MISRKVKGDLEFNPHASFVAPFGFEPPRNWFSLLRMKTEFSE
jgi:hypothetical protein